MVGIVLAIMLTACFVWNRQRGSMSDLMLANVEALQCKGINNISTNPNIIS